MIKELKKQNIKTGLSKNLANNYGLAQWDKAIINIPLRPKNGKTVQAGSDTILIIPLVEDGVNEVTSYLEARLTDTVHLQIYTANSYKHRPFATNTINTGSAENLAVRFMLFPDY